MCSITSGARGIYESESTGDDNPVLFWVFLFGGLLILGGAQSAVNKAPLSPTHRLMNLASEKKNQAFYQEAIECYTKLIGLKPNNDYYYDLRGDCYAKLTKNYIYSKRGVIYEVQVPENERWQNYRKALEDYTQAIKIDPNRDQSGRFLLQMQMKDKQGLLESYTKVLVSSLTASVCIIRALTFALS